MRNSSRLKAMASSSVRREFSHSSRCSYAATDRVGYGSPLLPHDRAAVGSPPLSRRLSSPTSGRPKILGIVRNIIGDEECVYTVTADLRNRKVVLGARFGGDKIGLQE
ncbi:hypothetical protein AAHA92_32954 [Salvia divinorum]|uniref:Uncharacterized protein n=1 Tax=Salvia divinorum TaxID=28513 RepID=A0ABD1FMD2_SALDI